jgi:hypothetical protein
LEGDNGMRAESAINLMVYCVISTYVSGDAVNEACNECINTKDDSISHRIITKDAV